MSTILENFDLSYWVIFLYKIIAKILVDRLASVATRIMSPNQFGFIPWRGILESIVIASKAANNLEKRYGRRNMILKLDIRKAFDTISWKFILVVLQSFGFCNKFRDWISEIFSSSRISILVNGSPHELLICSRGVCQGEPLSPLLFGIEEDFLSRSILNLCDNNMFEKLNLQSTVRSPPIYFMRMTY